MNIKTRHSRYDPGAAQRREAGVATIILILLLAIMMILVMAESRALVGLRREVKFIEQQQIKRLDAPQTNAVTTTSTEIK